MCAQPRTTRLRLILTELASRQARGVLRESACHELAPGVLDEALLLVTELVANAVRHAGPPVVLETTCAGAAGLGVRVSDGSHARPTVQLAEDHQESGRGVALVDRLSDAWGVQPTTTGKTVWFVLGQPGNWAPDGALLRA